jgi:hypothetical protein
MLDFLKAVPNEVWFGLLAAAGEVVVELSVSVFSRANEIITLQHYDVLPDGVEKFTSTLDYVTRAPSELGVKRALFGGSLWLRLVSPLIRVVGLRILAPGVLQLFSATALDSLFMVNLKNCCARFVLAGVCLAVLYPFEGIALALTADVSGERYDGVVDYWSHLVAEHGVIDALADVLYVDFGQQLLVLLGYVSVSFAIEFYCALRNPDGPKNSAHEAAWRCATDAGPYLVFNGIFACGLVRSGVAASKTSTQLRYRSFRGASSSLLERFELADIQMLGLTASFVGEALSALGNYAVDKLTNAPGVAVDDMDERLVQIQAIEDELVEQRHQLTAQRNQLTARRQQLAHELQLQQQQEQVAVDNHVHQD